MDQAEILTFIKAAAVITTTVLAWAEPLTLAVQHHLDIRKAAILRIIIKVMQHRVPAGLEGILQDTGVLMADRVS
jgi:hypothetical protein